MCGTYLEHPSDWRQHMDELMQKLYDAGFKNCVRKNVGQKMKDYEIIATHKNTSHCAPKSIKTYKKMTSELLRAISGYINETYGFDAPILDHNVEINIKLGEKTITLNNSFASNNYVVPGLTNKPLRSHPFVDYLIELVNRNGRSGKELYGDHEVYFSRKTFSKMLQGKSISKDNILKLAILLKLDLVETRKLLGLAGFGINKGIKRDLIIIYAIDHGIYDPGEVDWTLIEYGELELFNKE